VLILQQGKFKQEIVPIEDGDNTNGVAGDINVSGVAPNQRVALTVGNSSAEVVLNPGDFVKISNVTGQVMRMADADGNNLRYARYLGKEAALLDVNSVTPFDETLTVGIVPDQSLTVASGETGVGWFQLVETQGAQTA
jgi:hypothetical protein